MRRSIRLSSDWSMVWKHGRKMMDGSNVMDEVVEDEDLVYSGNHTIANEKSLPCVLEDARMI
jgi:hypothetical protein